MRRRFHTLDVFTDVAFTGNPLAVVVDAEGLSDQAMQAIAREFNLSETSFVLPPQDEANTARVRIFTPDRELAFAGHPTVGTAILLADLFGHDGEVRLEEGVGLVRVSLEARAAGPYAELAAARMPKPWNNVPHDKAIAAALELKPQQIGFGMHRPSVFDPGNHPMLFVPLADRASLAAARINQQAWPALGVAGAFLAYLYCPGEAGSGVDLHCRAYSPTTGIMEDPATGSAAAGLPGALFGFEGPWDGVRSWHLRQGEDMGRASDIWLSAEAVKGQLTAIRVGGHAVRVSEGTIDA